VKKGDYYYVDIAGIAAKNLDDFFHVEVSTSASGVIASIDYCALSYACKQLKDGEEGDLRDVVRALVLYNQAANAYLQG